MAVNIKNLKAATKAQLLDAVLDEAAKNNAMHNELATMIGDLRQLGWEAATHKDKLLFLSLANRLQDLHRRGR